MSTDDVAPKPRRFKHRSYQAQIKDVHLPSPLSQNAVDQEIADDQSHFQVALEQWRQLNLASAFLQFAKKAEPLSASLPLLLHNWEAVVELWIDAANETDLESKQPLLDLVQKLLYDLRTTLTPKYEAIWDTLLAQATRSLPPAAFEVYVQTLSLFLKHLLLPSPEHCNLTWNKLSATIRKCRPDVRHKLAEVWGTIFRRLKTENRREITSLMLESLSTIQDAMAWIYITAFQSTSPMLHTSAVSLLDMLWDEALVAEDFEAVSRLLRRSLSATMHYCTIESFQPMAAMIATRVYALRGLHQDEEKCWRTMEIALVVYAFRKGGHARSMLNSEQITTTLTTLAVTPLSERLKQNVTAMAVACLKGSEMSLWAKGREALEHVWKDILCGFWLAEALSKLEQSKGSNWKAFILPYVQKHWYTGFLQHPTQALRLLRALVTDGKIGLQDTIWKKTVQEACSTLLADWTLDELHVLHLHYILPLLSQLPELASLVTRAVGLILEAPIDPYQDYQTTAANAGWCLGSCLVALGQIQGWSKDVDVDGWFQVCLDKYNWSSKVLEGLARIVPHCTSRFAFVDVLDALGPSVMSHVNATRLNALRVLASDVIERDASERIAITACLRAEEVELSGTQTPERVLKTTKIGSLALGSSASSIDICTRWLLTQMKINLMPVWKAAAQALVALIERRGEEMWPIISKELKELFVLNGVETFEPPWAELSSMERPVHEDEKTWRNPGLQETLVALRSATSDDGMHALAESQNVSERLDVGNYERQVLKMLEGCPNFAERHNRDLVPLFLSFAAPETPTRSTHHKLSTWLSLFAKFNNPKAVFASESLHTLYTSLLSHPDRNLQTLAIDCVLSYKPKSLMAHESSIKGLLDDGQWKEHIMSLDLATTVQSADRQEYVEFLVRLFYGMMRERRGKNKLHDRRATILGALRQCTEQELGILVRLMLEPFGVGEHSMTEDVVTIPVLPESLSGKQQVGFFVLLGDVSRILGTKLVAYWASLLKTIIAVVANAQKVLESGKSLEGEQVMEEDQSDDAGSEQGDQLPQKVARNLRQLGIKRFTDHFRLPVEFDFRPYLPAAFNSFISCRVEMLDTENTQSPSALMELFHTWSMHPSQITFLVDYNALVLPKIYACLVASNVKAAVVSRVLDIIERVIATDPGSNEDLQQKLVKPHVSLLIGYLTTLIEEMSKAGSITSEGSQRQIRILRAISEHVDDKEQAAALLRLLLPLLRKPPRIVNENIKIDLLETICRLLLLLPQDGEQTPNIITSVYEATSQLLQTLRNRQARVSAAGVFVALASKDAAMMDTALLITSLNSFNPRRPQEPDFERRMEAFAKLNETLYLELTPLQWLPILNNILHFIHDAEELSIRNNAAYTMRRFIEIAEREESIEIKALFSKVLFVGLKRGLRSKHEHVCAELVSVIAYGIKQLPQLPVLQDMVPLLAGGDEEANFFNNIFHVQMHRRTRALRRLADHCDRGELKSSTLYDVFVPIIGHYIGNSSIDHLIVNEAINTVGRIAHQLIWSRYYALVQQYMKATKDKGPAEKINLRALVTILDSFHFTMEDVASVPIRDEGEDDEQTIVVPTTSMKIADAVHTRLLPSLLHFMEKREETEDTLRIPIAIGIVKVALHLPQEKQRPQITRLITILCQALRSKSSETRDMTRDVLCKIAVTAGPSYLLDIVKELRVALTRGPQLHVLAVTCHLLIHHITQDDHQKTFENLDSISASVAEVSAEVIFGQSNKDVHSEENKTTFRELRGASSKGLDAMTILAKHITPGHISSLLLPLRSIMHETEAMKVMQQVDETLKRISSGLNSNTSLDPSGLLSLCHTLISQNAKFLQEKPDARRKNRSKKDFVVQTKRDLPQSAGHYAHNSYRFVAFGLDLFVVAFRRNRFDFQNPDIIARLEPMVSVIGNTLYSTATPAVTLGLKAIAAITKAPLQSIPKVLPVVIRQQVEIVRQAGSAESEVAQASLKSLASTLRDCPTAQLREGDLKFILETMEPDLEEADRQAAVFALLRSIIQRKLVVPEIYDMMDKVANVVVTNQSTEVQETCRGILLQFLLDYPQGKGRLRKQMTFLASNLSYVFESGRISVMVLLDAIFRKFEPSILAEYADIFFMALVMVLVNDDSSKCREKASNLLKTLYLAMDAERRRQTMERLHVWITQGTQAALMSVSAQVYGLIIDVALDDAVQRLPIVLDDLNHSLEKAAEESEGVANEFSDPMEVDVNWQPVYHALVVLAKLLKALPESSSETVIAAISWDNVIELMLYSHAWVRAASSRLLGVMYASHATVGEGTSSEIQPMSRQGMIVVARNLCIQLRSEHLDLSFSLQIVKNLLFVAKSLHSAQHGGTEGDSEDSEDEEDDEEKVEDGNAEAKLARIARAPLPWLFSKLSYQIKTAHLKRRNSFIAASNWALEPTAILQWFAAMVSYLDAESLEHYLVHILTPVYGLLEDDTIRDTGMDDLKATAQELQDLVQSQVGTTKFTAVYGQIRQGTMALRRERKVARATLAASDPQRAAQRQIQRNMAKREGRKRKSQAFRENKVLNYPSKKRRVE